MAKIGFIQLAEDAFNNKTDKGEEMIIRNPALMFTPTYVPGQFSLTAIFSVEDVDVNQEYTIKMTIIDLSTQKQIVQEAKIPFKPHHDESDLYKEIYPGNIFNLNLNNIPFPSEGKYSIKISIDGNETIQNFYIYKKRENK